MPTNGLVRGNLDADAPHNHTQAGVPGVFRSWDDTNTSHIVGSGISPEHNGHIPPCDENISLQHIHTMVATNTETFINDRPPVLEGDVGCWSCPCDSGNIFDFIVNINPFEFYIEDKSVAVQGIDMMDSSSLHGGDGQLTNGGSGDFFVGVLKTSPEPHG